MRRWLAAVGVLLLLLLPACAPDAPEVSVWRLSTEGCGLADEISTGFSVGFSTVITTAHSLEGDGPVVQEGGVYDLTVGNLDARADVAVLYGVSRRGVVPEFRTARVGEDVNVVVIRDGQPTRMEATVRNVTTIRFHDAVAGTVVARDGLVLSIGIVGGDSGAPVLGHDGKVLGMMFANAKESTESYAVASSEIEALLATPPTPVERPSC